jgi:purine-nucleoside phosphorylase
MLEKVKETTEFLKSKTSIDPEIGIVLGSGLGGLVQEIDIEIRIDYEEIPNFPISTVEGHHGRLIFGTIGGKRAVVMQGRFHYYEGYSMQQLTFPIRVMKLLGIEKLLLSNASGGVNPQYSIGDLMILDDHINMLPSNPLIGQNHNLWGPRFPDMSEPYDKKLNEKARAIAKKHGFTTHTGVYASLPGPCFETRAEYRYIRTIGADTVGMSTVPEVIVARHMGIPCFAMSIITDLGGLDEVQVVSHEEVLKVANIAEAKMTVIFKELIESL